MATQNTLKLRAIKPSAGRFVHGGVFGAFPPCRLHPVAPVTVAKKSGHLPTWSFTAYELQRKRATMERELRARKRAWRGPWSPRLKRWLGGFDVIFPKMLDGLQAITLGGAEIPLGGAS